MPDATTFLALAMVILATSVIQGALGFGLGLLSAPVFMGLAPELMPATLIVLGGAVPVIILLREWRHTDWRGVGLALLARIPGIIVGTWLLVRLPARPVAVVVGLLVLGATVLQWRRWRVERTTTTLMGAGVIAGVMGALAGFSGPPVALVYQREPGPVVRASLSAFFLAGAVLTGSSLAVAGRVTPTHLVAAAALLPFLAVGALSARRLARHLDAGRTKHAVLVLAGFGGLTLAALNLVP